MIRDFYHRILRVALLVVAFVLLFDSGFVMPITKILSDNAMNYLANSAGVFAQVEPNELNMLTKELTERQQELDRREASLREIESRDFSGANEPDHSTYILSSILFVLTLLITVNYVLDWKRVRAFPV